MSNEKEQNRIDEICDLLLKTDVDKLWAINYNDQEDKGFYDYITEMKEKFNKLKEESKDYKDILKENETLQAELRHTTEYTINLEKDNKHANEVIIKFSEKMAMLMKEKDALKQQLERFKEETEKLEYKCGICKELTERTLEVEKLQKENKDLTERNKLAHPILESELEAIRKLQYDKELLTKENESLKSKETEFDKIFDSQVRDYNKLLEENNELREESLDFQESNLKYAEVQVSCNRTIKELQKENEALKAKLKKEQYDFHMEAEKENYKNELKKIKDL